jgi:pSer/pThr/pTyr-binding forkhead associated (FHA) protein
MPGLRIEIGGQTVVARLQGAIVRVGRDPACDLRIDDPSVSAVHLTIEPLPTGGYKLVDGNSGLPTIVNGLAAKRVALKDGDRIEVGPARITFLAEGVVEGPSAAPVPPEPVAAPPLPRPVPVPVRAVAPAAPRAAPIASAPPGAQRPFAAASPARGAVAPSTRLSSFPACLAAPPRSPPAAPRRVVAEAVDGHRRPAVFAASLGPRRC